MQTETETVPTGDTTGADPNASGTTTTATNSDKPDGAKETPLGDKPNADENTEKDASAATEDEPAPITYTDFVVPEGMTLDKNLVDKFSPILSKHKLSQEAAQELVNTYSEHLKSQMGGATEAFEQAYQDRRQADINAANAKGIEELKADPELGGKNFDAVRNRVIGAVAAVGSIELRQTFEKYGLGNDPAIVGFINKLIDYRPEDRGGLPPGGGGVGNSSITERLYGKTT
jgi:hypothetical protein